MKRRSGSLIGSVALVILIALLFSSCHKDKEVPPDYVGTWSTEEAYLTSQAVLQVKDVVTLTKDTYTDLLQLFDQSANRYIDYLKLTGNMTNNATVLYVELTEVGITTFDFITGKPTGTLQSYKEGTMEFENVFTQTGQAKSFSFEYSVSDNTLTIYSDNNSDGDYADANETVVYTRQ
jgi:hypothetical protein